jgi:hypothetical protein
MSSTVKMLQIYKGGQWMSLQTTAETAKNATAEKKEENNKKEQVKEKEVGYNFDALKGILNFANTQKLMTALQLVGIETQNFGFMGPMLNMQIGDSLGRIGGGKNLGKIKSALKLALLPNNAFTTIGPMLMFNKGIELPKEMFQVLTLTGGCSPIDMMLMNAIDSDDPGQLQQLAPIMMIQQFSGKEGGKGGFDMQSMLPLLMMNGGGGLFGGNKDGKGGNSMMSMLPFLMMNGGGGDLQSMLPILMMSGGLGGGKDSKGGFDMQSILPFMMMSGGGGLFGSGNTTKKDGTTQKQDNNPIMSMLPFLMMNGGGGDLQSMLPILMMSGGLGGNKDSKGGFDLQSILPIMMMSGGGGLFGGNNSGNTAQKNGTAAPKQDDPMSNIMSTMLLLKIGGMGGDSKGGFDMQSILPFMMMNGGGGGFGGNNLIQQMMMNQLGNSNPQLRMIMQFMQMQNGRSGGLFS